MQTGVGVIVMVSCGGQVVIDGRERAAMFDVADWFKKWEQRVRHVLTQSRPAHHDCARARACLPSLVAYGSVAIAPRHVRRCQCGLALPVRLAPRLP